MDEGSDLGRDLVRAPAELSLVPGGWPGADAADAAERAALSRTGVDNLWHVTVTVAGPAVESEEVYEALERLSIEHPFMLSALYAEDRAQVRYWEEAPNVHDALALALRLWGEHRVSAGLPCWSVVGLEVVDRETFRGRDDFIAVHSPGIRPF
ncbi:MAG: hypothetical protein ACT4P1_06610 [Sporichthyaceae bacterium]